MTDLLACPNVLDLRRLASGELPELRLLQVEQHVLSCSACAEQLNALQSSDPFLKEVQEACATQIPSDKTTDHLIERVVKLLPDVNEPKLKGLEAKKPESLSVSFACDCGAKLKARESLGGKTVKCPQCQKSVTVPSEEPDSQNALVDTSQQQLMQTVISGVGQAPDALAGDSEEKLRELTGFLSPPQAPDELGRLGPYRILKILGSGGMGVVYRAEDPQLKRIVALKAMLPGIAASASSKLRFIREAQAAARIKQDHIVTIYQVGEDRGTPFLAMEFLEGESLDDRIRREGKLPLKEVLRIGREIAEGLEAAHEESLIHRDIKPANIWLEKKKGRVKILDFGLARSVVDSAHLTQSGAIVGTPAYMAPEQAKGQNVDHRSDLFSLGCVLYRMTTGRPPFIGPDAISTLMSVAADTPPSPQELDASVPTALSDLIVRLLAKNPLDRPTSARKVAGTIEAIESQTPATAADSAVRSQTFMLQDADSKSTVALQPWSVERGPGNRNYRYLLIGSGFLGLLSLFAAATVSLITKDGTLVVEIDQPDAIVHVLNEKGEVQVETKSAGKPLTISVVPGQHVLKVSKDGFEFFTEKFSIGLWGKETVTAKLLPVKAGSPGPNASVNRTRPDALKFVDIFNGQALDGWTIVGDQLSFAVNASKGLLTATGKSGGWLLTDRDYADFILRLEYQAELGANSGFAVLASPADTQHLEIQLGLDNNCDTGGMWLPLENNQQLAYVPTTQPAREKPVDEWNSLEIELRSSQLKTLVNGMEVSRFNLDELSRRADATPALKRSKGRIGLQSRTNQVQFRNIRIAEIVPSSKSSEPWNTPAFQAWMKDVSALPAENQVAAVSKKLMELNPGFDGKVQHDIGNGNVTGFEIPTDTVSDISPVRALAGLKKLLCGRSWGNNRGKTILSDLAPLQGMGLERLDFADTAVSDLSPLEGMPLTNVNFGGTSVADLSPLREMKLTSVTCYGTQVTELSPLAGMPLWSLHVGDTPVSDLSPLRGIALGKLWCFGTNVFDLTPIDGTRLTEIRFTPRNITSGMGHLRQMKSLTVIGIGPDPNQAFPPAEFWKKYDAGELGKPSTPMTPITDFNSPAFLAWMKDVAALPAEKQVEAVAQKLIELNPGFDGKMTGDFGNGSPTITNGVVTILGFHTDHVTNISPVRALRGLQVLYCTGTGSRGTVEKAGGRLSDLSPIKGMKLLSLTIGQNRVHDLSPLTGMPLEFLLCWDNPIKDLSPLRTMPLKHLAAAITEVTDLSPLEGLKLETLQLHSTQVKDISPLKGMPLRELIIDNTRVADLSPVQTMPFLKSINCGTTQVSDLTPLKGKPLTHIICDGTLVTDLSPLQGMKLIDLFFKPSAITKGIDAVREMNSLEKIGVVASGYLAPDEFWKKYDAGEFSWNSPAFQQWVNIVAKLPAEKQVEAVTQKLKELNPGFDGQVMTVIENGTVKQLQFCTDEISDISPVRASNNLASLSINGSSRGAGKLQDLSPLNGIPLKDLSIQDNKVSDLSPLRRISLIKLNCIQSLVADLSPLREMPLTTLWVSGTPVKDISPLVNMPLDGLAIDHTQVRDLSPVKGMPLTALNTVGSKVTDISPLKDVPLKHLEIDFVFERDAANIRSIKTLESVNRKPIAEFWKEVEESQSRK